MNHVSSLRAAAIAAVLSAGAPFAAATFARAVPQAPPPMTPIAPPAIAYVARARLKATEMRSLSPR